MTEMMNGVLKYIILGVGLLTACSRQDALMYENDPRVFFSRGTSGKGQQDSILHSFFTVPEGVERDTVWVEISVMGFTSSESRPVKIVQTNTGEADAAVPGTHYVGFDDAEMSVHLVVATNAVSAKIPVILLRDRSLLLEKKRIKMAIVANEYFQPGIDKNRNFMVQTTAMAEKPGRWDSIWKSYFGAWGSQKMWFIVNYLGFSEFDDDFDTAYRKYLQLKARSKLAEYNTSHDEPLCEDPYKHHENGETCPNCVVFP